MTIEVPNAPGAAPIVGEAAPSVETEPTETLVDIEGFMKVKLRVARVVAAEPVPKSKKLLRLTVDLGPLGSRRILAGIAQHYEPESLIERKIVVVANLRPAKLMGLESQGMLLAASTEDGSALRLVDPGQEMPPGATVR
jgi:methionyl-tRNA synthetase